MTLQADLLELAEQVAKQENVALSTLGRKLVNDSRLFARLREGGSCRLETYQRLRAELERRLGMSASGKTKAA